MSGDAARFAVNLDQYSALPCRARALMRMDRRGKSDFAEIVNIILIQVIDHAKLIPKGQCSHVNR